jgi:L-asparagine oxygenase
MAMDVPGGSSRTAAAAVTVRAEQRDKLMAHLTEITGLAKGDFSRVLREVYPRIIRNIPDCVLSEISSLREVEARGYTLIRGLPVDDQAPPTPTAQTGNVLDILPIASALLLCASKLLGEPYTWSGEHDGSYLTSVLPTLADASSPSSHGAAPLPLHTEAVHLAPYMPSYVALYCVRPDPDAEVRTVLAEGREALAACTPETIELLRLPLFWVRAPKSFNQNTMTCGPISVVSGPLSYPEVKYESIDMAALNQDAAAALAIFGRELAANAVEVQLAAGDLLVFDNRKIAHGRTGFTPRLDGTDRWLLRSLVTADLWSIRQHLSGYHALHF